MSPVLEMKNIHKSFEIGTVNENHVLKGIDLTIHEGDFITIIGGNGAGKSTLMNSIAGSFPVDQGKISLEGKDITNEPTMKRAKYIGRVFQDPRMGTASRLTIEENMAVAWKRGKKRGFGIGVKDEQRHSFQEALKRLDLGLENRMKMEIGLLSGGQRQAVTLLMASLVTPKLLLLDEHTAALDPKTSQMVLDLTKKIVEEEKLTTLMITHNMEQAIQYGNRLIMLNEGNIVVDIAGEEKQHLTIPDLLELFHKNSGTILNEDALILS
ncbi:ABC transporter ATP-binding protein [Desemzia sp. RIT804]|uniref:ABC transporter ATP-binding protein n=1 Tax=Desemzia sp. RIT 804 TaxID=2810209 RepID=UPI00194EC8F8|nr:ABC transporter ATP-binding protein [Desemzia sp. RIT 804]MBM6613341.1 ABC transporter ATP-binding protein [Desemzia sp. RIT 804]